MTESLLETISNISIIGIIIGIIRGVYPPTTKALFPQLPLFRPLSHSPFPLPFPPPLP